ncbi:MAG TPA: pseudouridine synthase, partial [Propionibacteriaceae bacterium]|nr:pseudouridine synthase [Propionibacteriaceae bacterium]
MPRSPLPLRHGLNSAWVRTPSDADAASAGGFATMRDFLIHKIPRLAPDRIDEMFAEGRFVDEWGTPIARGAGFASNRFVFFHRDLPDEAPPPGELTVLHRDDRLVVLDKPHFTATIPRGHHVLHSAVVRARRELDLPELSPAHRLDRLTAGVLLCTTRREFRSAYQSLFEHRLPTK